MPTDNEEKLDVVHVGGEGGRLVPLYRVGDSYERADAIREAYARLPREGASVETVRHPIAIATLKTSELFAMMNTEILLQSMFGEELEHMTDKAAAVEEARRVYLDIAAEIDRRVPVPRAEGDQVLKLRSALTEALTEWWAYAAENADGGSNFPDAKRIAELSKLLEAPVPTAGGGDHGS